jgi:excinuclease UvrABC ATPase subunit
MPQGYIEIRGARENNLKNVSLRGGTNGPGKTDTGSG